jgi:thiamine-phosphate pyrophosphorylase
VRIARWLRDVCDERGAAMIVNDRLDVALAADADGVHLGQTDLPLAAARAAAESGARPLWIGVSTHDEEQVRAACAAGADYIGFGPVFETRTKANPDPVQGLAGLRAAVARAGAVPVVAIGGITADRVAGVYGAGAASICAIGAVNEAPDVRAAATMFSRKVT